MDTELAPLIEKAAAALKAAGAREVYVFGSASKGKLRPESDVDMAVSGLPPEVFFGAMGAAHDRSSIVDRRRSARVTHFCSVEVTHHWERHLEQNLE